MFSEFLVRSHYSVLRAVYSLLWHLPPQGAVPFSMTFLNLDKGPGKQIPSIHTSPAMPYSSFAMGKESLLKAQLVAILLWIHRQWRKQEISCYSRGIGQQNFSNLYGVSTTCFPWNCLWVWTRWEVITECFLEGSLDVISLVLSLCTSSVS